MDVEKTIQFLIENAAQHDARLSALEAGLLQNNTTLGTMMEVVKHVGEHVEQLAVSIDELRDTSVDALAERHELREIIRNTELRGAAERKQLGERLDRIATQLTEAIGKRGPGPVQ